MAAILTSGRARIHASQDVLLLVDAGVGVINHQPAGLAPVEFELALMALGVEKLEILRAAELTVHPTLYRTMWNAV
jgi:hypothetical protein